VTPNTRWGAITLAWMCGLRCTARPPTPVRVIELEDPQEEAKRAAGARRTPEPDPAVIASSTDQPAAPSKDDDGDFVYSRVPIAERMRAIPQLPIHINERWWPFRAQHLGITERQAERRDAQLSKEQAPADFWDSQTSVEAVSVWTVLCNECHGGRRSLEDAVEMPKPGAAWGQEEGLFFGNRRSYDQMFNTVYHGGPIRESGRAEMPAWRNILSTEMIWALLYFLEYQSGGIESRFPPSLYPRRPKMLGGP
jgi:hypothetical protein